MRRLGTVLLYIGGCVWVVYYAAKYLFEWDVDVREFLPYHLAAIIPGVALKHGRRLSERFFARVDRGN